jgi:hypothetical protein
MTGQWEKYREICDQLRKANYNYKYYSCKRDKTDKINQVLEIIISVGACASVFATVLWAATSIGKTISTLEYIFGAIALLPGVIGLIKPFFVLERKLDRYSKLKYTYYVHFTLIKTIFNEVKYQGLLSDENWLIFKYARDAIRNLEIDDDTKTSKKLEYKCFNEVNKELTPESLWINFKTR